MSYQEPPAGPSSQRDEPRVGIEVDGTVALIFGASLIELIEAAHHCDELDECKKANAYAVACGAISVFISLLFILAMRFSPTLTTSAAPFISIFLAIWWTVGAAYLTFKRPFTATGNGYFASWLAFITSSAFAYNAAAPVKSFVSRVQETSLGSGRAKQLLFLIFVASLVELIAACIEYDENHDTKKNQKAWAVACGVISLVSCLVFLAVPMLSMFIQYFGVFLSVWWIFGVGFMTFDAPFKFTGNGYFATWFAFLGSVYMTAVAFLGGQDV